ncbi:protein ANKUB1 [Echinops telfairi]|uniref:Protein ANKUB1 n=1 Tax=Echinops telfairi TaxID=9371 RepID=A0ABM0ZRV3_ECHTE|nr:protein ANKUB1 [Echinops telfairi]
MRIFVAFEGSFEPFDVSADESVGAVKRMIKEEDQPTLYVLNAVTQELLPIVDSISLLDNKVSELRTLVSLRCGFPVGVYCLRTPQGQEMYDCNTLGDYRIETGGTLRLDVWDGWKEFLRGCLLGQKLQVQRYLSEDGPILKYQRRVALYIAAFYGYVELTEWALKQGARPNEAVGAHPCRAWCHKALHADVSKCPIHAAAETGQLWVLKAFVHCSVLCLECRDAAGQSPLTLALRHRHQDCVLYLLNKMWSTVSFPEIAVPMRIYLRVKQWMLRAHRLRLHKSQLPRARISGARVGDPVAVDGFGKPSMTSQSWYKYQHQGPRGTRCQLPPLQGGWAGGRAGATTRAISLPNPREDTPRFPPLADASKASGGQRHAEENQKKNRAREKLIKRAYLPQVPLPPVSTMASAYPPCCSATPSAVLLLGSSSAAFARHSGKTPRENAIYCLAVASAFKEKPWLQQLGIARVLAKKSVANLTTPAAPTARAHPLHSVL